MTVIKIKKWVRKRKRKSLCTHKKGVLQDFITFFLML
jgi:hypothetical protein